MASTIQIKRGTGSAVPSGLADGELAINLDSGKLYFGSGSTSVNDFTFGEITAEKYIVSSSVLYVTTSFSSGSTEFGDTADDTHTFTGDITASGNISSSGTIQGSLIKNTSIVDSNNTYVVSIDTGGNSSFNGTANTAQSLTSGDKTVDGNLTVNGNVTIGDDGIIYSPGNMSFRIDSNVNEVGQKFSWTHNTGDVLAELDDSGVLTLYGNQLGQPAIVLEQTTQTATYGPPVFTFNRTAVAADNADIGRFDFKADDDATNQTTYAQIIGQTEESGNGTEGGKIAFKVASHDAELQTGLLIEDGDAEDEIDVTIGNTTTSLTTVAGNLSIGNSITSNITASGTISASGGIVGDLTGNADTATALTAGNKTLDGNLTIGSNGSGHDLLIYGDTSLASMQWDSTYDFLKFSDNAKIVFGSGVHASDFDSSIQADGNNLVIYNDTGNIRIGDTVEVTGQLHVSASGESKLDLIDTGGQAYRLFVRNSDDVFGIYDVTQTRTWFRYTGNATIGNTKLALLEGGGKVGIGNTSPPEVLTVEGNISSSGTVTADRFIGSQLTMVPWNYYVSSNHSDELYIPQGGSQVEVNSDQPYNFMLAPYDGKVRRLSVYYQTGDPGTLTARVRAAAAPFDLDDADDIVQELTQTSVVDDTAYFFDFSASFSKGEAVAVTLEAASHSAPSYVVGCIAVEYDTTT